MWAEFLGARNPIWRPAAILKITFSTIWPIVMTDLWLMGYFRPRNWLVMLVSSFHLSWPSNPIWRPTAILKIAFFILWSPVPCDLWFVGCLGQGNHLWCYFLDETRFRPSNARWSSCCKLPLQTLVPQDCPFLCFGGYFGSDNCDLVSVSWSGIIVIFKFEILHVTHLNLLTLDPLSSSLLLSSPLLSKYSWAMTWWQRVAHWLIFAIDDLPTMANWNWGRMFHQSEMELEICDVVCSCGVVVQCVIIRWEVICTLLF